MRIYDLKADSLTGESVSLEKYKGKVLLIVNTASKCGFTPQYRGLQDIYVTYKERGLEILGFPCNQFGAQEPGSDPEIAEFCNINYGVTFPVFKKVAVKGHDAHPLFKFLTAEAPGVLGTKTIKWNFTKFLVDREGKVISRHAPAAKPSELAEEIEKLL
ncbi:glutathione peroxidase [Bacillus massilinigeriensis]|uniref:glutathione peroxidase n=1 Tax=Bacillus mediterraneensis TaxID=1805474 RepID=UPI0008F8F032|nr:glutathione peroxidase [Bacillus mediterraneensis]